MADTRHTSSKYRKYIVFADPDFAVTFAVYNTPNDGRLRKFLFSFDWLLLLHKSICRRIAKKSVNCLLVVIYSASLLQLLFTMFSVSWVFFFAIFILILLIGSLIALIVFGPFLFALNPLLPNNDDLLKNAQALQTVHSLFIQNWQKLKSKIDPIPILKYVLIRVAVKQRAAD